MFLRRHSAPLIVFLCLSALGTVGLFWGTEIPLGVPGEWTWRRIIVPDDSHLAAVLGWITTAVVGTAYCLAAWLGARRIESASRGETTLWLVTLAAAGFAWLWFVQESPAPVENRLAKSPWVTYYRGPDGYFDEARYQMTDVASFLAGYEQRMTEGDVLHIGTHPPGMALLHRGMISLCRHSSALTRFLISTQPSSAVEAFDTIAQVEGSGPRAFLPEDRAAIWLAILFIQAIGVATVVPLFYLIGRFASREAAWMAVALWPLVPSLAVFLPKSDALFPCLGAAFLALWLYGRSHRSPLLCIVAGFVMWLGMFLSLAVLPVALLGVMLTMAEIAFESRAASGGPAFSAKIASMMKSAGWALVGFAAPILLLWLAWDANLIDIWSWNYRNHAGFYAKYTRTYAAWLWVNPLELIFGVGAPVIVLAAAACIKLRPWRRWNAQTACAAACFAVWAILWLSGKNMGEAARLWLVVMPWPIWIAAFSFDRNGMNTPTPISSTGAQPESSSPTAVWLVALAAQGVACAATVSRVNGFDFGLK